MSESLIYLASPYTAYNEDGSFNEELMHERAEAAIECFIHLTRAGFIVFCPIAMAGHIDKRMGRIDPKIWYAIDSLLVLKSEAVFVLKLPGWEDSKGVTHEINLARSHNIPVVFLEYLKTSG